MSDKASLPVEDSDSGVNGANEVPNERESPLSIVGDLSRIAWRTEIAYADGHSLESPRKSDEETEDFVAVKLEDDPDDWYLRSLKSRSLLNALHPFVQLLTVSNVDDCEKVEEAFPTSERASREKVYYTLGSYPPFCVFLSSSVRLSTCPITSLHCKNNDFCFKTGAQ